MATLQPTSTPLRPTDAIVVLGGEGASHNRTAQGVALYRQGRAPLVIFSGGPEVDASGAVQSSTERSRRAGLARGLPVAAAMSALAARSTYEEAQNLGAMAASYGWRTMIVVTDDYHCHRAARVFRAVNPGLTIILSPAPSPDHWWDSVAGLRNVGSELLKLAYYWLRYGVAPV